MKKLLQKVSRLAYLAALPFRAMPAQGRAVQFCNIGEGTREHGVLAMIPDAATTSRYLLYKTGSTPTNCAVCGAGDTPLGPSNDLADADALAQPIAIQLLGAVKGTLRVITDGTVANGNRIKCGANGKATAANTADVSFGIALITADATSANGDTIEFIPTIPAKYAF